MAEQPFALSPAELDMLREEAGRLTILEAETRGPVDLDALHARLRSARKAVKELADGTAPIFPGVGRYRRVAALRRAVRALVWALDEIVYLRARVAKLERPDADGER